MAGLPAFKGATWIYSSETAPPSGILDSTKFPFRLEQLEVR